MLLRADNRCKQYEGAQVGYQSGAGSRVNAVSTFKSVAEAD